MCYTGFSGGCTYKNNHALKYIPQRGGGKGRGKLGFSTKYHRRENVQIE